MRSLPLLSATLLFAVATTAQTHTLRGKVEDVQGTQNQFFLDGTNLPLVSTALNLNQWVGQQAILDVVNVGTPTAPVLRVDAAVPTNKIMDMGNLRLGQTKTFEVFAPVGTTAYIMMDLTSNAGFRPLPGFGVWLLGTSPYLHAFGPTNFLGVFQTTFSTPNNPALVGIQVSSQAVLENSAGFSFSNVDSKTVEQ